MSIGLYDDDFATYIHVPFNLELMKLSSYYKNRKEIVTLSPFFCPEKYTKFFIRKDYYDGKFPENILLIKNLSYGGLAFSNNKYIPLDLEIEKQIPDTSIYFKYKEMFSTNERFKINFNTLANSEHLRLSLDGIHLWEDYFNQIKNFNIPNNLFFHDYNLNSIENCIDIIKDLLNRFQKNKVKGKIGSKFPIQVNSNKELLNWIKFIPLENFFTIQFNGIMEDEVFVEFINTSPLITINQFEYNIGSASSLTNQKIISLLPKIYKQVIFSRRHKKKISLKYEDNFFIDKRWNEVIQLINMYSTTIINLDQKKFNYYIKDDTMFKFAKKLEEKPRFKNRTINKQKAREIFQFVRENNYELFKLFYECSNVKLKGGVLKNEGI